MDNMRPLLAKAITAALKKLLSEKHLYQYVEVDTNFIADVAKQIHEESRTVIFAGGRTSKRTSLEEAKRHCVMQTMIIWHPDVVTTNEVVGFQSGMQPIGFELPTVNTFCEVCQARPPFNSVPNRSFWLRGNLQDELYLLGYQCQQCKDQLIYFLVRREFLKLRLAGRYPLEVLPTPKVLPKGVNKYFSNAQIAYHAGQTLAGLFLLRVFIEQFWRTIPEVQKLIAEQPKATGDEQGNIYQGVLPTDFKSRFPSLTDCYNKLSAAIHTADENAALFEDTCAKIEKHFEARRLYEL